MIRTITEAECLALTVPGDVPGVLDGYIGPVRWGQASALWAYVGMIQDCHYAASGDDGRHDAYVGRDYLGDTHQGLFLPLARPEVQAHLVGWLGRGERCPDCRGARVDTAKPITSATTPCPSCRGSGWIRRPVNRYAWLTPEAHGGLPDWIRLALIWGSVVRVAAGMEALRAAEPVPVSPRGPFTVGNAVAWWTATEERRGWFATRSNGVVLYPGWMWDTEHGPEIGAAALDRIYSCVMSQGFALIDEAPTGRAIRFEVTS